MFMPNRRSPVNLAGRVTTRLMQRGQQTTLDQLTRPKPRAAKKNTEASESNITKVANRPKVAEQHASHAAPESESQEGEELTSGQSSHTQRHKIRNAAEGKAFLEEEGLVDPNEAPDIAAMVSTLIQISMLRDTPVMVSNTVHAVVLVLMQIKPEVDR